MPCRVCNIKERRYKCPKCLLPYCSINCWKIHQNDGCQIIRKDAHEENENPSKYSYNFITDSTVVIDKLRLLEASDGLKDVLRNPHVRTILSSIDKSNNPAADVESAMQEPIFIEFVDECLKVIEPPKEQ